MGSLYENIKTKINEGEHYFYIGGANYEKYGYDGVYNSEANTDVNFILRELKRYFDESVPYVEATIKNATHDPGVSQKDVDTLKFCSQKVDEIINKINSTWE